ncbi:UNVERIFIED_CONTAM: hypothetical protein GTU68_063906 [Idotea baltica]|nr:hypothetical protein [Idotea baltica]
MQGVSYSVKKFLGPNCWSEGGPTVVGAGAGAEEEDCFHRSCLRQPRRNALFHVAIYLAPGDYHRFHSPAEWRVGFRRHFPGELLSVNPSIAAWVRELFVLNERVAYVGEWAHGFFSMTAVGATNVGSIAVPFDASLRTNARRRSPFLDKFFDEEVSKAKGEEFGEFNLGSTIVLIFEAPKDSQVAVEPGQKVKVGQPLLRIE